MITADTANEIVVQAEAVDGVNVAPVETIHVCSDCDSISDHFRPRCPKCGGYNSLVETDRRHVAMKPVRFAVPIWTAPDAHRLPNYSGGALVTSHDGVVVPSFGSAPGGALMTLGELEQMTGSGRLMTGESSLDFVLGGGLVAPSVILIGGEAGVGKSTLLTQMFGNIGMKMKTYYSAGEEAPEAISMRVQRVAAINDANRANCLLRRGSSFLQVMRDLNEHKPKLVVFDSLQAHLHDKVDPTGERYKRGSTQQVIPMAKELHTWAHSNGAAVWIVCHLTKDGEFAGPQTVMHDVDANMMLTRLDNGQVAATTEKNRFGATDVVGLFDMTDGGLKSV